MIIFFPFTSSTIPQLLQEQGIGGRDFCDLSVVRFQGWRGQKRAIAVQLGLISPLPLSLTEVTQYTTRLGVVILAKAEMGQMGRGETAHNATG